MATKTAWYGQLLLRECREKWENAQNIEAYIFVNSEFKDQKKRANDLIFY